MSFLILRLPSEISNHIYSFLLLKELAILDSSILNQLDRLSFLESLKNHLRDFMIINRKSCEWCLRKKMKTKRIIIMNGFEDEQEMEESPVMKFIKSCQNCLWCIYFKRIIDIPDAMMINFPNLWYLEFYSYPEHSFDQQLHKIFHRSLSQFINCNQQFKEKTRYDFINYVHCGDLCLNSFVCDFYQLDSVHHFDLEFFLIGWLRSRNLPDREQRDLIELFRQMINYVAESDNDYGDDSEVEDRDDYRQKVLQRNKSSEKPIPTIIDGNTFIAMDVGDETLVLRDRPSTNYKFDLHLTKFPKNKRVKVLDSHIKFIGSCIASTYRPFIVEESQTNV